MVGSSPFPPSLERSLVEEGIETRRMRSSLAERLFAKPAEPVRIGRFVIIERIGSGGMGTVYAAYDPDLDRRVAVKLLDSRMHSRSEARRWLAAEAKALARLNHPNVVTLYDLGLCDERLYMAMEFLGGGTLRQWCARHPIGAPGRVQQLQRFFVQAARGLEAAHRVGLVHRDLKPGNLLIGDDQRLRIADFGLARHRSEPSTDASAESLDDAPSDDPLRSSTIVRTATGGWVGSPGFMAPEQFDGEATALSDQYSLCAAFFDALFGRLPHPEPTIESLRARQREGRVEVPAGAGVPLWLRRLLVRGLDKDPRRRFSTIAELLGELERGGRAARRVRVLGVSLMLAIPAIGWWSQSAEPPSCPSAFADPLASWGPATGSALREGFARQSAIDSPMALAEVEGVFAKQARAFTAAELAVCRARLDAGLSPLDNSLADGSPDPRRACLDRVGQQHAYFGSRLAGADDQTWRDALPIAMVLPDPGQCVEAAGDYAAVAIEATQSTELSEGLRALELASAAGRTDETIALAGDLLPRAEHLPTTSAWIENLLILTNLGGGHLTAAEAAAHRALRAAEAADTPVLLVRVWEHLAIVLRSQDRFVEAEFALERARSVIDRKHMPAVAEAEWLYHRGALDHFAGRVPRAIEAYERAITLCERHGARLPTGLLQHLAQSYFAIGRGDRAVEVARRSLAESRARHGSNHVLHATDLITIGALLVAQDRSDEAVEMLRRGLEIFERYPVEYKAVSRAIGHSSLATAMNVAERFVDAERHATTALEVLDAMESPAADVQRSALEALGRSRLERGDVSGAFASYERALELAVRHERMAADQLAIAAQLARIELRAGKPRDALQRATELERRLEDPRWPASARGPAELGLAEVLEDLGETARAERAYARALAAFSQYEAPTRAVSRAQAGRTRLSR